MAAFILFASLPSFAGLTIFERKWSDKFPTVPDLVSHQKPNKLPVMSQLKWYAKKRKWRDCLRISKGQLGKKELQLWVAHVHLQCLRESFQEASIRKVGDFIVLFDKLKPAKQVLLQSPFRIHKDQLLESFLELMDAASVTRKDLLDSFINRHQDLVDYMGEAQRARYYYVLGEMALQRKEQDLAIQNYLRSYEFSSSDRAKKRLEELNAVALLNLPEENDEAIFSEEENKLWNEFKLEAAKPNHQAIAKIGVDFLKTYAGSIRVTEVAEIMLDTLRKVVYRRGEKFEAIKRDVTKTLSKAPARYLVEWSTSMYGRGYYQEALELAEPAAEGLDEKGEGADALLLAGKSAYFLADWKTSEKHLRKLAEKYRGHDNCDEAQYYLGLLLYRQEDYKAMIPLYEKFLLQPGSAMWELQVRYWLWRALMKTSPDRANEQAEVILRKFPLTYYGLQVRAETQKSLQTLFTGKLKQISVKYWWSDDSKARWNRIKKLLSYGWTEEAEKEIDLLPSPTTPEGHLLRAQLWTNANRSVRAMMELSMAIDKDNSLLSKEVLTMAFPKRFVELVNKHAAQREIDRDLILAIIRQESGFLVDAVSPSNAVGLMQLVRVTANETAKWLKVRKYSFPDSLINPDLNIRFGSHYLSRMIRKYKGIIPLALAAYNVGPGNMDRWLRQRQDLQDWDKFGQNHLDDMWMDELPWGETSFYAKAILRNYLLYKIIFNGEEKLNTPVWNDAQSIVPYDKAS